MFEFKACQVVEFDYTNWEGIQNRRKVRTSKVLFGATEHHPEEQWLLEAFDFDRGATRFFAMKDMRNIQ